MAFVTKYGSVMLSSGRVEAPALQAPDEGADNVLLPLLALYAHEVYELESPTDQPLVRRDGHRPGSYTRPLFGLT
jgi:hypothetical protein